MHGDRNCKSNHIRMHHWFYHVNPNQSISRCDSTLYAHPPQKVYAATSKGLTATGRALVDGRARLRAFHMQRAKRRLTEKSWKQHYDSCYNKLWNDWCKEHQKNAWVSVGVEHQEECISQRGVLSTRKNACVSVGANHKLQANFSCKYNKTILIMARVCEDNTILYPGDMAFDFGRTTRVLED